MLPRTRALHTTAVSLLAATTLFACSTKADQSTGGGDGDLKTDYGVTDDTITLGVLTDLSGVFKGVGVAATQAQEIWVDKVNANGGICDRQIELNVMDTGYKPDNTLPLLEQSKSEIVGLLQVLGSPIFASIKQKIESEQILAGSAAAASNTLESDMVLMVGQTYDTEMINGLAFLQEQGQLADGDTIGHVYADSEYGQSAASGVAHYADEHGLEVVSVPVSGTDTDMTATVAKLKASGVTVIGMTLAPAATTSIAVQNVEQGLNVPLMGSGPTFGPTMLENESTLPAFENYYFSTSFTPLGAGQPLLDEVLEKYTTDYPDVPSPGIGQGYSEGQVWEHLLTQACEDGDMTREGLLEARKKVTSVDTEGITAGPLDYSTPGAPPSRMGYVVQIDPTAPDGQKIVGDAAESDEAKSYQAPYGTW